jgi:uncharacterized membrane protein
MGLGPIELLVLGFPGNRFTGGILPQIEKLVDDGVITIVDALIVHKDADGVLDIVELDQIDAGDEVSALGRFLDEGNGLISEEDVEEFAGALPDGSSAAALAFEHTWFKPLRDELVDSGGILLADVRIPGLVVDEVLEAVASLEDE